MTRAQDPRVSPTASQGLDQMYGRADPVPVKLNCRLPGIERIALRRNRIISGQETYWD